MSPQSATFYAYINTGQESKDFATAGYSYAMIHTGVEPKDFEPTGYSYAMINAGVKLSSPSPIDTAYSYFNLGLPVQSEETVVHGARGWGVLPAGSTQFIVLKEGARAASYSYLNTTENK